MDAARFDHIVRSFGTGSSRRRLLSRLTAAALGVGVAGRFADRTTAKKKKKLVFNQFGCVDVGGKCRGNSANCCSNVCEGKKPKKGKKDKSRCVAHNTGSCQPGQDSCLGTAFPCGTNGLCFQTTGLAAFCSDTGTNCFDCKKDTDCEPLFGAGAACVVCFGDCPQTGERECLRPHA
jgi:hypothetical protein